MFINLKSHLDNMQKTNAAQVNGRRSSVSHDVNLIVYFHRLKALLD